MGNAMVVSTLVPRCSDAFFATEFDCVTQPVPSEPRFFEAKSSHTHRRLGSRWNVPWLVPLPRCCEAFFATEEVEWHDHRFAQSWQVQLARHTLQNMFSLLLCGTSS